MLRFQVRGAGGPRHGDDLYLVVLYGKEGKLSCSALQNNGIVTGLAKLDPEDTTDTGITVNPGGRGESNEGVFSRSRKVNACKGTRGDNEDIFRTQGIDLPMLLEVVSQYPGSEPPAPDVLEGKLIIEGTDGTRSRGEIHFQDLVEVTAFKFHPFRLS